MFAEDHNEECVLDTYFWVNPDKRYWSIAWGVFAALAVSQCEKRGLLCLPWAQDVKDQSSLSLLHYLLQVKQKSESLVAANRSG